MDKSFISYWQCTMCKWYICRWFICCTLFCSTWWKSINFILFVQFAQSIFFVQFIKISKPNFFNISWQIIQFLRIFVYTFYIIQQRKLLQKSVVGLHNFNVVVGFNKSIFDIEHFMFYINFNLTIQNGEHFDYIEHILYN